MHRVWVGNVYKAQDPQREVQSRAPYKVVAKPSTTTPHPALMLNVTDTSTSESIIAIVSISENMRYIVGFIR